MKSITLFALLTSLITFNACDRPECKNTNIVFNSSTPDKQEYKKELAKQIETTGADALSYWYMGYEKKNNGEFITVNIQGGDLCAIGELEVRNWDKIEGMRREPSGYHGAEMKGLKIKFEQDSTRTNFVYDGLDRILD